MIMKESRNHGNFQIPRNILPLFRLFNHITEKHNLVSFEMFSFSPFGWNVLNIGFYFFFLLFRYCFLFFFLNGDFVGS